MCVSGERTSLSYNNLSSVSIGTSVPGEQGPLGPQGERDPQGIPGKDGATGATGLKVNLVKMVRLDLWNQMGLRAHKVSLDQ